ncbi:MAG: sugar phosphate nucleotidyltransferase [Actinomycetota bacterium]
MVLAAGRGTRMQPLSRERPKPLMPTLDVPQISWVLTNLARAGVDRVWVNAHLDLERFLALAERDARHLGLEIMVSHEAERPLGTAGALRRLAHQLDETFVLASADLACDFDVTDLIEAHRRAGAAATLLGVPTDEAADFIVKEGRVLHLTDRRDTSRSGHLYGNIGIFEPGTLDYIPEGVSSLLQSVMMGLMRDGGGMAAVEWKGYWLNVGTPSDHLRANLDALSSLRDAKMACSAVNDGWERWDSLAYVGSGARVRGADLRHAVVGRGAHVAPGTILERCVVWEGASVVGDDYRDAVITPEQVLRVHGQWIGEGRG